MLFQSALLTCEQKSFSISEKGVSCQVPAGLVSCRPSHDQRKRKFCQWHQPQSHILIRWVCLFLLISFPVTGRVEENYLCACSLTNSLKAWKTFWIALGLSLQLDCLLHEKTSIVWGPHKSSEFSSNIFNLSTGRQQTALWGRSGWHARLSVPLRRDDAHHAP